VKKKLLIAFAAAIFNILVAIAIVAHCGSTWITQSPTFGPQLGSNGCTQQLVHRQRQLSPIQDRAEQEVWCVELN